MGCLSLKKKGKEEKKWLTLKELQRLPSIKLCI